MTKGIETLKLYDDVTREDLIQAIEKLVKYLDNYLAKMRLNPAGKKAADNYLYENVHDIAKSAKVASEMAYLYSFGKTSEWIYQGVKHLTKVSTVLEYGTNYSIGFVLLDEYYPVIDFLEELKAHEEE